MTDFPEKYIFKSWEIIWGVFENPIYDTYILVFRCKKDNIFKDFKFEISNRFYKNEKLYKYYLNEVCDKLDEIEDELYKMKDEDWSKI